MNREQAWAYVSFGVDDAQAPREAEEAPDNARLVGWQCGFEPLFVAVWSHLGSTLDDEEAVELATDLLNERDWWPDGPREPDFVL